MQLLNVVLHVNFYVATLISAVLVFLGNYIFSKLWVFRKKADE